MGTCCWPINKWYFIYMQVIFTEQVSFTCIRGMDHTPSMPNRVGRLLSVCPPSMLIRQAILFFIPEFLSPSLTEKMWHISNYPKGIYTYRTTVDTCFRVIYHCHIPVKILELIIKTFLALSSALSCYFTNHSSAVHIIPHIFTHGIGFLAILVEYWNRNVLSDKSLIVLWN